MAWFNPQRVEFTPSETVLRSQSAIGDWANNLYKQNYGEQRDATKDAQWQQGYNLQNAKFDWEKGRAVVEDDKWTKDFGERQVNNAHTRGMKEKEYIAGRQDAGDRRIYQNGMLGIHNKELGLKQSAYDDTKKALRNIGISYGAANPEAIKLYGNDPVALGNIATFKKAQDPTGYQALQIQLGNDRITAAKEKAAEDLKLGRLKQAPKIFESIPMYSKLNPTQQQEAIDIFVTTGQLPKIKEQQGNHFWDSDTYSLVSGDNNATQYDSSSDIEAAKQLAEAAKALRSK